MATAASKGKAIALYRRLLRSARTWPGPAEDKQYILDETRRLFRLNQGLSNREEINSAIFDGESRYDLAWHYKIPYPRLHNFPTGAVTETPSKAGAPYFEIPSDEKATLDDSKPSEFKGWADIAVRH